MYSIIRNLRNIQNPRSRKAIKNVIVSFGLKGVSMIMSLVLVPLTLSYLTQYEYGVWLTLTSILVWLDFFDIGLTNGLRNKLAESIAKEDWDRGRAYVSTTFFILSLIGFLIIILFSLISFYIDWDAVLNTKENPIPQLSEIVFIVFVLCIINFVMKTIGTIFSANQEPMMSNLFSCIGQAFSVIIIYILTQVTDGNLMYVAIAFSISPILVYVISYPYAFYVRFPKLSPSYKYVKLKLARDIVGIGVQFFLIQVVCLILYQSSNIIIAQLFNPIEVTPYNIGYRYMNVIVMLFMIVITPLWTAITDAFTKKDYIWIQKSISVMMRIWLLFVALVVLFFVFSTFAIELWVGKSVHVPEIVIIALGIFVILDMWNRIFASFANGITHLKIQLFTAIAEGVLFIPLAVLFSQFMGVSGVAWALTAVSIIPAIALYIDYKRTINYLIG